MKDTDGVQSRRGLDDARMGTTKSLTSMLRERIRADIITGDLPAGQKLKIGDLSGTYRVSPSIVREILSHLAAEGLVDSIDQRGFRAPVISEASVLDVTRVRLLTEREALLDAMRHGSDKWEADIVAAHYRLERCELEAVPTTSAEWSARHKEFHHALIAACSSAWLIRLHEMLYNQTERFRFISASFGDVATGTRRDVADEHARLAEAVIGRQEALAVDLMEAHLQRTAKRVLAVRSNPGRGRAGRATAEPARSGA